MGDREVNPNCHIRERFIAGGMKPGDAGIFEKCRDPKCGTEIIHCTCIGCFPELHEYHATRTGGVS
jgi:hypothetical protein